MPLSPVGPVNDMSLSSLCPLCLPRKCIRGETVNVGSGRWFGSRDFHGIAQFPEPLHQLVLQAVLVRRAIVVGPFFLIGLGSGQQRMHHAQNPVTDGQTSTLAAAPTGDPL